MSVPFELLEGEIACWGHCYWRY